MDSVFFFFMGVVAIATAIPVKELEEGRSGAGVQAPNYQHANNGHGCCISTSTSQFHQRCSCPSLSISECKTFCDQDTHCVGYVEHLRFTECQFATTSTCPSGCSETDVGIVGEVTDHGTCGSSYGGCFIKETTPNPCNTDNGGCEQTCTNKDGTAFCSCTTGTLDDDNKACITEVQIFKFNDTCCKVKGVPEECMGLCRERINRRSIDVYPVDRCVEHQNSITSCLYQYVPAVDCEWNDWQIGECSKTCAGGSRTNSRTKKIEESNGTDEDGVCEGEATMDEACNMQNCPRIHCEWNAWVLGECSDACGTGTRNNTRTKSVIEANGGTCSGQPSEIEECNTHPCPIDCKWGEWTIGVCTKACGGGFQTNTRDPAPAAQHGGQNCTGHSSVTESCNIQECPVHCEWSDWENGECSVTCGGGERTDSRVMYKENFGGNPCEGEATRQEECNTNECPVDCKWGDWTMGNCSVTCGGGVQVDSRSEVQKALYGGLPCEGEATREGECNTNNCPIDCEWNDWQMGECSKTCGGGSRTNNRTKKTEEDFGGVCVGEPTMQDDCNDQKCPPIHCVWNEWVIGECSDSCGTGTRKNTRTKLVVEEHGGTCTGQPSEFEECNTQPCPIIYKFGEKCCEGNGVPEECMGLCRDRAETRSVDIKYPIDRCVEHRPTIASCIYQEVSCKTDSDCPGGRPVCRNDVCDEVNKYVSLGCWKDTSESIAIPTLEGKSNILDGSNSSRKNAIEKCYKAALSRGYKVFAVQYGGFCSSSSDAESRYKLYGNSSGCELDGKGGELANHVYQIQENDKESQSGPSEEEDSKEGDNNTDVDCKWGGWIIGKCSATCGDGLQIDYREKFEEDFGGEPCEGDATRQKECNIKACPVAATCSDQMMNGDETGIDCGGATCLACASVAAAAVSTLAANPALITTATVGGQNVVLEVVSEAASENSDGSTLTASANVDGSTSSASKNSDAIEVGAEKYIHFDKKE